MELSVGDRIMLEMPGITYEGEVKNVDDPDFPVIRLDGLDFDMVFPAERLTKVG